ncbi:MAG: DUF3052 family protein [Opitutaceae bacterium]|nr:DUF3052 family protein [Opitutaceae bacterium]
MLRLGAGEFPGTAHLDSAALVFRGGAKLAVALNTVKAADVAKAGELRVTHTGGVFSLLLGDRATAEKWALKVRYPKSLIDKLGLKPESRVAVLGVDDAEFRKQAAARLKSPPLTRLPPNPPAAGGGLDFIFYPADSEAELARLTELKHHLAPTGAIWVVSLKGKAARVKDVDVMRAAKAAGLVDNKVCGFSATHTALKLVIPVAARG